MTTKKKSSAPKVEPKADWVATEQDKELAEREASIRKGYIPVSPVDGTAKEKSATSILIETEGMAKNGMSEKDEERIFGKNPTRFKVGDIAQHNGSNYLCIATNGQQCAVFVPSHIQTTYSRVVEQRCLLMNNEPIKEQA